MTKMMKYIIGIVSLIIIILFIIPCFISLDTYKEIIANQVKKQTGHDLKIGGEISLAILPTPQIKLTQLKLSSLPQAKAPNLLEAEIISGKLLLLPLLKGKVVVSSLELIKPVINLEVLKNGKGTWEFQNVKVADQVAPLAATQNASMQSKNSLENMPFLINNISIQNGTLRYVDKGKNISIKDLDLDITISDIYSHTNSGLTTSGTSQTDGRPWSHKKIDLSALNIANATIRFKAKNLSKDHLLFENISMKSELEDGVLKIISLNGGLYGAKLEGSGSISGKSNQPLALKLTLKNAQIHNIVPEGRKIKVTGGIVDLSCNIQSHGASQFDYVKNMHGSISLRGKDGKLSGINLKKLVDTLDKPRDINLLASGLEDSIGKGETTFNSLKSDAVIDKGIMNITNCELISNETSASSKGKINLPSFNLDVSSTINSGVKYLPPITINFYGSLDNPQHKIDVKAIWQYLAKHALTGVIENLKHGKIKPQDLLKGIIGGNKQSNKDKTSNTEVEDDNKSQNGAVNKLLQEGIKGLLK